MSSNKAHKITVQLWCEGKTEISYFESLLAHLKSKKSPINLKYENLEGGNYKSIKIALEKEKYFDKIFIIVDLDRADKEEEFKNLQDLIKVIRKRLNNIFLFLTYKNFEDWIRFHFADKPNKKQLYEKFNVKNEKNFKKIKNLYKEIYSKGGNIQNAEEFFKTRSLFYNEGKTDKDNLGKIQSNLYSFRQILANISSSKNIIEKLEYLMHSF